MQRLIALFLIIVVLLSGCATDIPQSTPTPEPEPTSTPTPMSVIEYVRQPTYDAAIASIEALCSEDVMDAIRSTTTNDADTLDYAALYATVQEHYDLVPDGDWTQNELIIAELVHEYVQNFYQICCQRILFDKPDAQGLVATFYTTSLEGVNSRYTKLQQTKESFLKATSIDEIKAIKEEITVEIGEDLQDEFSDEVKTVPTEAHGNVAALPLEIVSGYADRAKYNIELSVQVKNTGTVDIDAFDFAVRAYNAYGETIEYLGNDTLGCTYSNGDIVEADGLSNDDWYWPIYHYDEASDVQVALTRCHTVDGETLILGEADYVWVNIQVN